MIQALAAAFGRSAASGAAGAATRGAAARGAAGKAAPSAGKATGSQISETIENAAGLAKNGNDFMKEAVGKPFEIMADTIGKSTSLVENNLNGFIQQLDILPDGVKKFSDALSKLTNTVVQRGEQLSMYSGGLASASAESDVRKIMSDIKEASYLENSYSNVIDESSKFSANLTEVLNPIKDAIAEELADLISKGNDILEWLKSNEDSIVMIVECSRIAVAFFLLDFDKAKKLWEELPEKMAKALRRDDTNENNWMDQLFRNSIDSLERVKPRENIPAGPNNLGLQIGFS